MVLQLLSCGFVSVLSSSGFVFVVSDSPIILIICVTFHCLIILLMLGSLTGNKEFVSWVGALLHICGASCTELNS